MYSSYPRVAAIVCRTLTIWKQEKGKSIYAKRWKKIKKEDLIKCLGIVSDYHDASDYSRYVWCCCTSTNGRQNIIPFIRSCIANAFSSTVYKFVCFVCTEVVNATRCLWSWRSRWQIFVFSFFLNFFYTTNGLFFVFLKKTTSSDWETFALYSYLFIYQWWCCVGLLACSTCAFVNLKACSWFELWMRFKRIWIEMIYWYINCHGSEILKGRCGYAELLACPKVGALTDSCSVRR